MVYYTARGAKGPVPATRKIYTGSWISNSLDNVPGKPHIVQHMAWIDELYLAFRAKELEKDMAEHRKRMADERTATERMRRALKREKSRLYQSLGRPAGPAFRRCMEGPDQELKPWMSNLTVLEMVYNTVNYFRILNRTSSGNDLSCRTSHSFEPFSSYAEVVITQGDVNQYSGKFGITMDLISHPGEARSFIFSDPRNSDLAWSTTFYDKFVLQYGENSLRTGGRIPGKDAWVVPAKRMWDLVRWSVRVRPYGLHWLENHVELKYAEGASGRNGDLVSFESDFIK